MTDLFMAKFLIHYGMHLVAPAHIARLWDKAGWLQGYLLLLATMLVDVDHLLARPIYDPHRMSIGFHPLHSYVAIACYTLMLAIPGRVRVLAIGLLWHMVTDAVDGYLL
jgi:hypothetical protein